MLSLVRTALESTDAWPKADDEANARPSPSAAMTVP